MIDRDEAHRRLDNLLDDLEKLRGANDPESMADSERRVVASFASLSKPLVGDVYARRRGATALELSSEKEMSTDISPSVAAGSDRWTIGELQASAEDQRRPIRRVIARSALDAEDAGLFQPGFGTALHIALQAANLGDDRFGSWLWPHRKPGEQKTMIEQVTLWTIAARVFYQSGYTGESAHRLWEREVEDLAHIGKSWDALKKDRHRDKDLDQICKLQREEGKWDAAAGRPSRCNFGAQYDLAELKTGLRRSIA